MPELRGTVKRIIFSNTETNFYVFTLENNSSVKKAKGNFLLDAPYPGQEVHLSGEWQDTKYGPTFNADSLVTGEPTTVDGIERYLIAYVDQIGQVTARRLVEHFGEETLDVLSNAPERLDEVPNLNKTQRLNLAAEWQDHSLFRETAIHLLNIDLPDYLIKRAYKMWGAETMSIVDSNPYRLMEVPGCGFVTADRIALAQGVAPDSTYRIGACIEYALRQSSNGAGHMYMPVDKLINKVYYLIRKNEVTGFGRKLNTQDVREALAQLRERERIVVDSGKIYLKALHNYEVRSAEMLADIIGSHELFDLDVEHFIDDYERVHSIQFSPQQREAITACQDHKVVLVTGLPGTGKTTLTKAIVKLFQESNLRFQLLSPTGIAAKRLSNVVGEPAMTIHRALGAKRDGSWDHDENNKLALDAVIVDEVSMIDQHVMYRLLSALNEETLLVFVGDHAQLPSVGAGNVLHEMIRSGCIERINLTQIFRQEEASDIILNAHRINAGREPVYGNPTDKNVDFRFISKDNVSEIIQGMLSVVDGIQSKAKKETTFQVLSPRWRGGLGVNTLNEEIRELLNPKTSQREAHFKTLSLREGDRVVVTANDYEKGIYNGEVGTVVSIDPRQSEVSIRIRDFGNQKTVHIPYSEVTELLNLAFCITIHKSQGSEYDYIIMPFVRAFGIQLQRNLLYTAVTRAKKKVFIFGDRQAIKTAVENDEVAQRNTVLAERLIGCLEQSSSG